MSEPTFTEALGAPWRALPAIILRFAALGVFGAVLTSAAIALFGSAADTRYPNESTPAHALASGSRPLEYSRPGKNYACPPGHHWEPDGRICLIN